MRPSRVCALMMLVVSILTAPGSGIGFGSRAFAQAESVQPRYISQIDQDLNLKNILLVPFTDNVSGIYAKPVTEHVRASLSSDPRWSLASVASDESLSLLDDPARVLGLLANHGADAVLTGRLRKDAAGIRLQVFLYTKPQGQLLMSEEAAEDQRFSTDFILDLTSQTLQRLRSRLPYQGVITSRRGRLVTLNLGRNSGLTNGMDVDVVQILKIHRHPKMSFMIAADKEILGKVRVFKADEESSFADIVFEKEPSLLASGQKVFYAPPTVYPDRGVPGDPLAPPGSQPFEWLPAHEPQYGRLRVLAGLGQFHQSASLTATGKTGVSNNLTPNVGLAGEAWLNRDWWLGFSVKQSAFRVNGDRNVSLSHYDLAAGYNLLLSEDFFGPKLQFSLGLGSHSVRISESQPITFTNMTYGGSFFGFAFTTPIQDQSPWEVGLKFKYYPDPDASESVSSGPVKSVNASDFSFLIARSVRQNFRYVGELNIEGYGADFNPTGNRPNPASDVNLHSTTIFAGIEYLF